MGTVLVGGEISSHNGNEGQSVEIMRRNSRRLNILDARAGQKIHSRGLQAGNGRDQRRNVIAQQLPLFAVDILSLVEGYSSRPPGKDGRDALGIRVRQVFEQNR